MNQSKYSPWMPDFWSTILPQLGSRNAHTLLLTSTDLVGWAKSWANHRYGEDQGWKDLAK